jgi:chemotaxis response regulator CheB
MQRTGRSRSKSPILNVCATGQGKDVHRKLRALNLAVVMTMAIQMTECRFGAGK